MDDILRVPAHLKEDFAHKIDGLSAFFKGRIVTPEQLEYDAFRALCLSNWDHKPAIIARVLDAEDVAAALRFARLNDLEVAIRSGGHSVAGFGGCDGGMVIDMREIDSLEIAADKSSVWAGAGLTAGEVTMALEKHQVIIPFGDASTVGIGGITLGGGIGYLVRKHGLTIDSLLAVELVTAGGEIIIADEHNHPALFWALRGGGGNFGVVTRFKYRLHALPEFTGGPLVLPATAETLAGYIAAAEAAPEELSTIVMVMPAPPLPFVPEHVIGQTVIVGMLAFAGPAHEAGKALAPFRALAEPLVDLVGPAPLSSLYLPEDPDPKPSVCIRSMFTQGMNVKQAGRILALLEECDAPMRMAQIRVLGGAAARVSADATAYAHRHARVMVSFLSMDAPQANPRHERWVSHCLAEMRGPDTSVYVNFIANEGPDRIMDAYPKTTWNRLRLVKRQYDPHNVFHFNQNIPPAQLPSA